MSEPHPPAPPTVEGGERDRRKDDFRALAAVTRRDLPDLATIVGCARRQRAGRPREERWMSVVRTTKSRPWIATALAGGLAGLALLVVPVSYDRVTAHDVRVTLAGEVGQDQLAAIARELQSALGAGAVRVEATGPERTLAATVPVRRGLDAAAVAEAFGASLRAQGYRAEASARAITERVSTSVAAYALDRVVTVDLDGKSAAQIEAEIRRRFAEAGIRDAEVSVTQEPEGDGTRLGVRIKARKTVEPGQPETPETPVPELVLRKGGAPIGGGEGIEVQVAKMKRGDATTMVVDVTQSGRKAQARVENAGALADADLARAIQGQLDAAGLKVRVEVVNGAVEVEATR